MVNPLHRLKPVKKLKRKRVGNSIGDRFDICRKNNGFNVFMKSNNGVIINELNITSEFAGRTFYTILWKLERDT